MQALPTHPPSLGNAPTQRTDWGFDIRIHTRDGDHAQEIRKHLPEQGPVKAFSLAPL
jgi:hypothetical protein